MNLWLVTSIRLEPATALRASSIQNLQTAMALADLGHRVLLWAAHVHAEARPIIEQRLGREVPEGLRLMAYTPRGPREEKKTPFNNVLGRLANIARAHLAAPTPDAVITRSPRVIGQLRTSRLLPTGARLVLEYQYPEWAQLWREWRRRHKDAPLHEAVDRLAAWRRQEDAWLPQADGILYAARGHETLLRRAAFAGPSRWLPSGCLPPDDAPPPDPAQADFDMGYVGSLAPENGLEGLLRALALLPGARLLMVGGGKEAYVEQLRALAAQLGLAERIEFAGPVNFHEVRALMRRCRVGVAPITPRQGPEKRQFASPLKLIEWMGAGVPVVATAVPSVSQFAQDGRNCLVIPPEDPMVLAAAVRRLVIDPELAGSLAREGLAAAAAAAWPNRARRIAEFISAIRGE